MIPKPFSILHALSKCACMKQVGCFNHRVVTLVAEKLETVVMGGSLLVFKAGRYKTWTLNSELDYRLDYGLDFGVKLMFWNFSGLPTIRLLIASSLVPKIRFLCIFSVHMVGLRPRQ